VEAKLKIRLTSREFKAVSDRITARIKYLSTEADGEMRDNTQLLDWSA
jgi:hypothetical protein